MKRNLINDSIEHMKSADNNGKLLLEVITSFSIKAFNASTVSFISSCPGNDILELFLSRFVYRNYDFDISDYDADMADEKIFKSPNDGYYAHAHSQALTIKLDKRLRTR